MGILNKAPRDGAETNSRAASSTTSAQLAVTIAVHPMEIKWPLHVQPLFGSLGVLCPIELEEWSDLSLVAGG